MQSNKLRGEQRLLRALLHAADRDLAAAFARKDGRAVRQFENETIRLRLLVQRAGQAGGLQAAI